MKLTSKLVRTLAPGQDPSKVERVDASKQGVSKVRCGLGLRSVTVAWISPTLGHRLSAQLPIQWCASLSSRRLASSEPVPRSCAWT